VLLAVTEDIDPIAHPELVFPQFALERSLHQGLWYDLRRARTKRSGLPGVRPLEDILTQLAAHLTGKAVAEVTSAWYREQRRLARNRTVYVSVSACAVIAAVVGGYQAYLATKEAQRSDAERFVQSGMRSQTVGDLVGAREAFRGSLRHTDTTIGRFQLAAVIDLPFLPKAALNVSPTSNDDGHGLTTAAFAGPSSVVTGDTLGNLNLINLDEGIIAWSTKVNASVNAIAVSANSEQLAVGLEDGRVLWIDSRNGAISAERKFPNAVRGIRMDRTGQHLAVGLANDSGILVLDPDGKELMRMDTHTGIVQGMAFNRERTYIYWADRDPIYGVAQLGTPIVNRSHL
jgi:hypothetical protein